MSIGDLVLAVRRHLPVFLGCVVLTVAIGAYLAYSAPRSYTAQTQLFVSSTGTESGATSLQDNSLAQQRVPSYAALVSSPIVADAVVKQLRLPQSAAAVAQRIEASSPLDVAVIDVTVHDSTARGAYDIATAVGAVFGTVVGRIEAAPTGASPIKVTVVRPPVQPVQPTGTGALPKLLLALLLGLNLGAVAAVVRDRTDTRVKDPEDLRTNLGLRPLATIALDSAADRASPAQASWPSPAPAEGFRTLRTNLLVLLSSRGLRSVLVTGLHAGDGSSAVARDLAVALGLARVRVLLVEANLRQATMARRWGLDEGSGLSAVLSGATDVRDAIRPWRPGMADLPAGMVDLPAGMDLPPGMVDLLPAGPPVANTSELLASQAMSDLIGKLEGDYDLVLFDAPDLPRVSDATALATRTGGTVLTVWQGRTGRTEVRQALQALRDVDARVLGAVVLRGRPGQVQRWRGAPVVRTDQDTSPVDEETSPIWPQPGSRLHQRLGLTAVPHHDVPDRGGLASVGIGRDRPAEPDARDTSVDEPAPRQRQPPAGQ
ncbi:MAG TPA: Wzz/FepE/Etk N-terminal domain-containing protein [Catenuloplanes sp.]